MKRWKRTIQMSSFVVVLAAMGFVVADFLLGGPLSDPREADASDAQRVEQAPGEHAGTVLRPPEGEWIGALGIIEPASPVVALGPGMAGRISLVKAHEGDLVEQGQILVELEQSVEQAALAAAEADVGAAKAELARTQRGRPLDIVAAESELAAAQSRAELSQNVYERVRMAAEGDGATRDEVDRARHTAEADAATARRSKAHRNASRGNRHEDVLAASARLAAAKARRDQASAVLDRMRITSPIAGQILSIGFQPGEYVQPGGNPVIEVGDTSRMRTRLDLDERDVGRIAIGAQVIVTIDGQPHRRSEGSVIDLCRIMGARNAASATNADRDDMVVLDVVVALENSTGLVTGQRVFAYIASDGAS